MNCLHCGASVSNGLALCDLCQRKVTTDLHYLPIYFRNLARWRPGRAGSRPVPGSREPTLNRGSGDRVSRALDECGNALTTFVRMLTESRPTLLDIHPLEAAFADLRGAHLTETETTHWICHSLERWLTSIATTDWCAQFVVEIGEHEKILRSLTEDVAPGWYAGGCKGCGYATHVVPGLTWITCGYCGTTTSARDHLETVLNEARGWVARPKALAEAVVALVDTEQSVVRLYERIKKWAQRERLEAFRKIDQDGDEVGPKRFRLGDVLDLVQREGETRVRAPNVRAS